MENKCYPVSASNVRINGVEGRRRFFRIAQLAFLALTGPSWTVASAFAPSQPRSRRHSALSSSLSSLTVKELKQLVRETATQRGVLSRLKKKQDLINYLEENREAFPTQEEARDPVQAKPNARLQKMPPLQTEDSVIINGGTDEPLGHAAAPSIPSGDNGHTEEEKTADITTGSGLASPKDAIFEQVYQRYPPVRDLPEAGYIQPADDVRQLHHPIFENNNKACDMDVVFVGTASCTPGVTRGVSCTALRLNWKRRAAFLDSSTGRTEQVSSFNGGTWLFDVGECTQLQVQKSSAVKPSKITKIFVTHAHGDHSFGLPGLLCLMGQDRDRENAPPVEIYGPEGLRMWLRVAIRYSVSRIVPPYRVHEIMDVPMAPEWEFNPRARRYFYKRRPNGPPRQWGKSGLAGEDPSNWISQANTMQLEASPLYGEINGGRNIYPSYDHSMASDGAPVWEVEDEEDVKVYAAPMSHGIPCLGYVVEELPRPGRLRSEYVEPIVRRNVKALKQAGFNVPMKAMAVIKNLPPGSAFTFPDGTLVSQEDAVEPPRKGRKVVVCGDTADCRALRVLARDADIVIHEATNAYLRGVDKDTNLKAVTRDAVVHGHSTPQIAGDFCRAVNAKRLILNHFSARYKGDVSVDSLSIMMRIEQQAIRASGLTETQVAAAWDLMVLPIPQN